MFQTKEQNITPGKNSNEMEISNLPDRVQRNGYRMFTELGRIMEEHNKNFSKDLKNKRTNQK